MVSRRYIGGDSCCRNFEQFHRRGCLNLNDPARALPFSVQESGFPEFHIPTRSLVESKYPLRERSRLGEPGATDGELPAVPEEIR